MKERKKKQYEPALKFSKRNIHLLLFLRLLLDQVFSKLVGLIAESVESGHHIQYQVLELNHQHGVVSLVQTLVKFGYVVLEKKRTEGMKERNKREHE